MTRSAQRIGLRQTIGLVLILPLAISLFPTAVTADCGGCSPSPMDCCGGKPAGCAEKAPRVAPVGCCGPQDLPPAPVTNSVPVPAQDGDRLHAGATQLTVAAARNANAIIDERPARKLAQATPLFTIHSVLLI